MSDVRNTSGLAFYPGPSGQAPTVTISLDGAAPSTLSAGATTEIAAGQYKTSLTAAQRNADTVFGTVTFPGYSAMGFTIQLEAGQLAYDSDVKWIKNNMTFGRVYLPTYTPASGAAADISYVITNVGQLKSLLFSIGVSGVAIANTDTWVTSDVAGNIIVAGPLLTDANGQVEYELARGSYYLFVDDPQVPQPTQFSA